MDCIEYLYRDVKYEDQVDSTIKFIHQYIRYLMPDQNLDVLSYTGGEKDKTGTTHLVVLVESPEQNKELVSVLQSLTFDFYMYKNMLLYINSG